MVATVQRSCDAVRPPRGSSNPEQRHQPQLIFRFWMGNDATRPATDHRQPDLSLVHRNDHVSTS